MSSEQPKYTTIRWVYMDCTSPLN